MRRLLPRLLLALAPTVLIVAGVDRWLAATTTERAEAVFGAIADPALALPDVVLGSSHAVHGVDPRALDATGAAYWNLALDGAGPGYLARWYRHFRRARPAPRRALLVVPWFMFKRDVLARTWATAAEHLDGAALAEAAREAPGEVPDLLWHRFPFLKHRDRLLSGAWGPAREGVGFRERRGFAPYPPGVYRPGKPEPKHRAPDDPGELAATAALLDALRADGVAPVLVVLPTLASETPPHGASDAALRALARARGLRLLDYQADPRLPLAADRAAYRDWSHLNALGAARLSARLAADLGLPRSPADVGAR